MTNGRRSSGFTLIEVMIAVGIAAIIAVTAFGPLIFTINSLEATQKSWGHEDIERSTAKAIFSDVGSAFTDSKYRSCKIKRRDTLGTDNNSILTVWTRSNLKRNMPVSVVVYKTIEKSAFTESKPGLYRWMIDASKKKDETTDDPMDVDTESLKPEDGKLLLKGVVSVTFLVKDKDEWKQEYDGNTPPAMKIVFAYEESRHEYQEWFPDIK